MLFRLIEEKDSSTYTVLLSLTINDDIFLPFSFLRGIDANLYRAVRA